MEARKFEVVRFISRGKYSLVYEVGYTQGNDNITSTTWALKRYYLQNDSSIQCALRERNILVRIARARKQSPFVGTLLESLRICGSPALVLRKGCGFDLRDLIEIIGLLSEKEARFYACEVISGLEHLHSIGIVHLDVKPKNTLLDDSGHVFITDFDSAYDMTAATGAPRRIDFGGTPLFMAPEVRHKVDITTKADVWSLGILVAVIIYKHVSVRDWLLSGELMLGHVPRATTCLKEFFIACLRQDYTTRIDILGVKCLDFFKGVEWDEVASLKLKPPVLPWKLKVVDSKDSGRHDPHDPIILAAAYSQHMPLADARLQAIYDKHGGRRSMRVPENNKEILKHTLTSERINELFTDFDFTNPHPLPSTHAEDANSTANGDQCVPSEVEQGNPGGCSSNSRCCG
ncbi:unnamed protein product [Hydatigera taeniaeformis]|uniref:Protein kinase domain-containing protein n=1 Tax=Hydatigena taeniaeformis TaxID=6205 RepID=A0A0R3WU03_HYDTA|nr:unnamed protein product [Hydatigera taeniaeformis]